MCADGVECQHRRRLRQAGVPLPGDRLEVADADGGLHSFDVSDVGHRCDGYLCVGRWLASLAAVRISAIDFEEEVECCPCGPCGPGGLASPAEYRELMQAVGIPCPDCALTYAKEPEQWREHERRAREALPEWRQGCACALHHERLALDLAVLLAMTPSMRTFIWGSFRIRARREFAERKCSWKKLLERDRWDTVGPPRVRDTDITLAAPHGPTAAGMPAAA